MDIALGILNLSVSESRTADRQALVELARSRGYHLAEVLIIDDETYMPTAYIAERARTARAGAILAPSLEHFGVAARALLYICALVVPEPPAPACESSRGQLAVGTQARGRRSIRGPVIAAAALVVFLVVVWALWPAPDSVPAPAVVVIPAQTGLSGVDQFPGIESQRVVPDVGSLSCRPHQSC
ncbi:hypothetical protein IU449_06775 [Nocardia higoensis]|uniref:Uncharacterized protein n=1 Tax=Nocardia higoensis TaxID=228599 RepID=A0ABS0D810_9NOCA|nr:hypothetical protein [Nocardia higoensis]MBF6354245.1 hypothetical protein [Nocardia higoensis]